MEPDFDRQTNCGGQLIGSRILNPGISARDFFERNSEKKSHNVWLSLSAKKMEESFFFGEKPKSFLFSEAIGKEIKFVAQFQEYGRVARSRSKTCRFNFSRVAKFGCLRFAVRFRPSSRGRSSR